MTTKTDFVTKYPSVLQTSSYNFTETNTTTEVCAGIVKAAPVHPKNPAQHACDLESLECREELEPVFKNPKTNKKKRIECVCVDGGNDEGPAHILVQFFWTRRYLEKGTIVHQITTRDAGSSNKNRVELQNGCLAQGHSNLFIPSTLNGYCIENGKLNQEKLAQNLNDAINVYISRVDGCKCGDAKITLFEGPDSADYQKLRQHLRIYLKGKEEEKKALQNNHPEQFQYIDKIWNLRNSHMVKGLPSKYVFHLVCCYNRKCIHPVCQNGPPDDPHAWYAGGPPVNFLPLPVPDPKSCGQLYNLYTYILNCL